MPVTLVAQVKLPEDAQFWTFLRRGVLTVHVGSCQLCHNGMGRSYPEKPHRPVTDEWKGPFSSLQIRRKAKTAKLCRRCMAGVIWAESFRRRARRKLGP